MAKIVRYTGSSDWSALYVDGMLDRVGDHYLIDERISQLLGVEEVGSDDFLRGGSHREDVAEDLAAIDAYRAAETDRKVDAMRRQAKEMLQAARALQEEAAALGSAESKA